jgi:hypothetical protein
MINYLNSRFSFPQNGDKKKVPFVFIWNYVLKPVLKGGHLPILEYFFFENYKLNCDAFGFESKKQYLDWLGRGVKSSGILRASQICKFSAQSGNLRLLQWFKAANCKIYHWDVFLVAARRGFVDILEWTFQECVMPIFSGSLSIVWGDVDKQVMCNVMGKNGRILCNVMAKNGRINALKWLYEKTGNGCFASSTCREAACISKKKGSLALETLVWLRSKDCPWDQATCLSAAIKGNLEVLKWSVENGCPTNSACYVNAAVYIDAHEENEQKKKLGFEMLNYLKGRVSVTDGSPHLCMLRVLRISVESCNMELFRWIMGEDASLDDMDKCRVSSSCLHELWGRSGVRFLKFIAKYSKWDRANLLDEAKSWKATARAHSEMDVVMWINSEFPELVENT